MPVDLSQSGYNAGRGVARMERNDSVERAVKGGMGLLSNVTSFAVSLDEGIYNSEAKKATERLNTLLWGNGSTGTEGELSLYSSMNSDYSKYGESYTEILDRYMNVDYLTNELGLSERNAERFIEENGDEYRFNVSRAAEQDALQSQIVQETNNITSSRQYEASRLDKSDEEAYATIVEEYDNSASQIWDPSGLQDPRNFRAQISFYGQRATYKGENIIKDLARTTDMTQSQILEAALAPMREYIGNADFGDNNEAKVLMGLTEESITNHLQDLVSTEMAAAVTESNTRFAQASSRMAEIWQENPEYQMSDEEFARFVSDELGWDIEHNPYDRQNADLLYSTMVEGNDAAVGRIFADYLADPETGQAFYDTLNETVYSAIQSGNTDMVTIRFNSTGTVQAVDEELNDVDIAGLPEVYTVEEIPDTPSGNALRTIIDRHNRDKQAQEGFKSEFTIPKAVADLIQQLPESMRNDRDVLMNIIEKTGTYIDNISESYSNSMKKTAMGIAGDVRYSTQERLDMLDDAFYKAKTIDKASWLEARESVSFPYETEMGYVNDALKVALRATGDEEWSALYDRITTDPDYVDGTEKWIISWKQAGGTIQSVGIEQYAQKQIALFMNAEQQKIEDRVVNKAITEMLGEDLIIGTSVAFGESDPAKLQRLRDDGQMWWIDDDAIASIRSQLAYGEDSEVISYDDTRELGARMIYQMDYDQLADHEKAVVDDNCVFAVWDQTNFELLHDTFITGQGLDGYAEVTVRTNDGNRLGVLGSDGFVYFMPTYNYNDKQTAEFFYVGTDSPDYVNAMSGNPTTIDFAGKAFGIYRRPSEDEWLHYGRELAKAEDAPTSISDWKDYILINPARRGSPTSITIDDRFWDVVSEDNIDELLGQIARDPEYKYFYYQIQEAWTNRLTSGLTGDQTMGATVGHMSGLDPSYPALNKDPYTIQNDVRFTTSLANVKQMTLNASGRNKNNART